MQVTLPPPKYDHAYPGVVIEKILPLTEAQALCVQIGVGAYDGCSGFVVLNDGSRACFIVLPTGAPDENLDHYRHHEIAHCNGWSANHGE
jgi:hypothetical protein